MSDPGLDGKTALVTGATGGIGRAIAARLAAAGCRLLLTGTRQDRLQGVAEELPGEHACIAADLASDRDLEWLIAAARDMRGGPDILVNNAGVFPVSPIFETSMETFDLCFAINVRAPFILTKALSPAMAERGWGRIVNIGSSSAYSGFGDTVAYCASKHALLGLSRSSNAELKDDGVLTICVSPGSVQTEMGRAVPGQDFSTFIRPEEVADWVYFATAHDGNAVNEEIRLTRRTLR